MEILLGLIGLVVGAAAGRLTAPKPSVGGEDQAAGRIKALEAELDEARRARAAAETALREAEAAPAPDEAPAAAGGDAELLAAENAALKKALAAAEARAATAEMR